MLRAVKRRLPRRWLAAVIASVAALVGAAVAVAPTGAMAITSAECDAQVNDTRASSYRCLLVSKRECALFH